MRKLLIAAALAIWAMPLMPGSAGATQSCVAGSDAAICQPLVECFDAGAVILLISAPADAVGYYRGCMSLDRRHRLHTHASGRDHAHVRGRRLRTSRSTFWPLYCEAQRRAGNQADDVCEQVEPAVTGVARRQRWRGVRPRTAIPRLAARARISLHTPLRRWLSPAVFRGA